MQMNKDQQEDLKNNLASGDSLFSAVSNAQAKRASIEAAAKLIFENWDVFLNTEQGPAIVKKIKALRPAYYERNYGKDAMGIDDACSEMFLNCLH